MAKGRQPHPFSVVKQTNDKKCLSKDTIRKREANEPTIKQKLLICPKHLSPAAKAEWKRLAKLYLELEDALLNDLDLNVLEAYCNTLERYRKAVTMLDTADGRPLDVVLSPQGTKVNPWFKVMVESANLLKRYGELLLLDPVSRARVGLARSKEEELSPMAQMLRGGE
jgi:P27 family predicted phage terminase small subunit